MGFKRFLIAMTAALLLPVATLAAAEEITFKIDLPPMKWSSLRYSF